MGTKFKKTIDIISFVLLAAILFDCTAFGGGSLVKIFGIDFRMVLYILFFVVSLPLVFFYIKPLLKNKFLWAVLAFSLWLLLSTANGILKGNRFDLILSSWIGFASFVILPGTLCVLRDKKQITSMMKVMIAASLILAIQSLLVLIAYQILPWADFDELNLFILYSELGGCTVVDDAVIRIFFRSHPLMIVSCAFCLYFSVFDNPKKHLKYCAYIAFFLFSLMLSYTRSIYFGILVSVAVLLPCFMFAASKEQKKVLYKVFGKTAAILIVLILVCDVLFQGLFLSYGIYRTTGIDVAGKITSALGIETSKETSPTDSTEIGITAPTEAVKPTAPVESTVPVETTVPVEVQTDVNQISDRVRETTQKELYKEIAQKPLVGHGIGAMLDARPEGDNEYFFLDVLFKMGVIGCILYLLPLLFMVAYLIKSISTKHMQGHEMYIAWLSGLIGIVAFSWFNPYLNGTNGIVLYCITMCAFSVYSDEQKTASPHNEQ